MVRYFDTREREEEILDLIVDSYIHESKPISSGYLQKKYELSYSPATIRNIMFSLERQGFLLHIHTSSGRVPTQRGFKHYVERFSDLKYDSEKDLYPIKRLHDSIVPVALDEFVNYALEGLTQLSGYTSLLAISGEHEGFFYRGMRFMLEQPEFEDSEALKNIFYALEVNINKMQDLLFNYIDDKIQIIIGEDIGCDEISNCSLIVSGLRDEKIAMALALLGPIRMDYGRAVSCLHSTKNKLQDIFSEII